MSEMVERVARALNLCAAGDPARCELGNRCTCRSAARAAIEAMREPTEEMVERVFDGTIFGCASRDEIRNGHRAMIEAALK